MPQFQPKSREHAEYCRMALELELLRVPKVQAEKRRCVCRSILQIACSLFWQRNMQSLRTLESHALTHTYVVLRAPSNEREQRCSRAPKARAEKIWELHVNLTQKCLFAQPVLANSAETKPIQNHATRLRKCRAPLPMQMERESDVRECRRHERRKLGDFASDLTRKLKKLDR